MDEKRQIPRAAIYYLFLVSLVTNSSSAFRTRVSLHVSSRPVSHSLAGRSQAVTEPDGSWVEWLKLSLPPPLTATDAGTSVLVLGLAPGCCFVFDYLLSPQPLLPHFSLLVSVLSFNPSLRLFLLILTSAVKWLTQM